MPNFSKDPQTVLGANVGQSYVGARLMQGAPLPDRDHTLGGELVAAAIRQVFRPHIGEGTPFGAGNSFAITPPNQPGNDFFINAGAIFVGGIEVKENVSFSYSNQPPIAGQPGLPALTGRANLQLPRSDLIYLDVWPGQVDSAQDPALFNPNDVEMETAVRLIPRWQVRVAEGQNIQAAPLPQIPAPQPGHVHYLLAQLNRTSLVNDQITAPMLVDKRAKNICMFPLLGRVATARASTDLLKKYLGPTFAPHPYSHEYGFEGRCLTIHGYHLNAGDVTVEFREADASANAPWTPGTIVDVPQAGSVTVRIPAGVMGATKVAITSGVSRAVATKTLYIYGPPQFAAMPRYQGHEGGLVQVVTKGHQISPLSTHANKPVTLYGEFFDMPGAVVEVCPEGTNQWKKVIIVPGKATATTLQINAPLTSGDHVVRVTTPASPTPAVSTEMLYVHP